MNAMLDLSESRTLPIDAAYQLILSTSDVVGAEFFTAMSKGLAETLGVRWILVSRVSRKNSEKAITVAAWDNGPADPMEYDLAGSPCENILTQGICEYPDRLQQQFPRDRLLQDMGAQAYVGIPLHSSTGKVLGLIAALHDAPIKHAAVIGDAIRLFSGRAGAEMERIAAASANERLGRIVEDSVSEAYVFSAETFKFHLVNRGARQNLGYSMEELSALTPWDLKPEYSEADFKQFVQPLFDGTANDLRFETKHRRKDGTLYDVEVQLQYFPGAHNVFFASITDVTERKDAERREAVLVKEVNHRSKNLLSLVQVIARQTAARHPDNFVNELEERIGSLAANQDLLVNNFWSQIPLTDLIEAQLEPLKDLVGTRITISGQPVKVQAKAAQTLGMAFHELATNAVKYGALSNQSGTVSITWEIDQSGKLFRLNWQERGGPTVTQPSRSGFGSVVTMRQPATALNADVTADFNEDGLRYQLVAPLNSVIE